MTRLLVVLTLLLAGLAGVFAPKARAAGPCDVGGNPVACENSKPGAPKSEWDKISGGGQTIEGFTTRFSVNVGTTVQFKINTPASQYSIDIYRMGYYGGSGARKVKSLVPEAPLPQTQPNCMSDNTTGLVDCGNWAVSASWAIPSDAVSGVYFAHLTRTDGVNDDNHIVFVVRNDASHSDMVFKTSDSTWQAYNQWGGNSLYHGDSAVASGRAVKVSYNRPFTTRDTSPWGRDFVFANEYPMIRFLEGNGYDVSYLASMDADGNGALLKNHKTFLSVGHDEYWSKNERENVEAARDAGVNLAFFSGNEVYWKTRWENAIDGSGTPYRTLVTYKETTAGAKTDPTPAWTGTWRDPRFMDPPEGGRPENGLTGTIFTVNCCGVALKVPAADGKMRLWRGTSVASQLPGATATLADQTVGYEWDEDLDNGARPAGLFQLSTTTANVQEKLVGYGPNVAPGTATHHLTMYKAPSGALVFGAGTVQWSWGLDPEHDANGDAPTSADAAMRQATVNLFADMGVQPATRQSDLAAAAKTTDTVKPVSTITSPAGGTNLGNGGKTTVTGTATDSGGQVAGVEVSTDGGTTWHPATGRGSWSYSWDAAGSGPVAIKSRAVDDSGNIETPGTGVSVNVNCPCRLFGDSTVPAKPADSDTTPIEAGLKFTTNTGGWVTGVRFYKGTGNTGTHTGNLWDSNGTKLATTTFQNETATGWQQATFGTAVQIQPGTTYTISYFAPNGHYAADPGYFAKSGLTNGPLSAPDAGISGGNGVYRAGSSGVPNATYGGGNYYVDVLFSTVKPPDTVAPIVLDATPLTGSSSNKTGTKPAVTFSEPVQAGTPVVTVKNGTTAIAGTAALDSGRTVLTFTPSAALPNDADLTVTVAGAKDDAGNTMASYSYSFRTAKAAPAPGVCPCSLWTDDTAPAVEGVNDPKEIELGVRFTPDTTGFIKGIRFYKGRNNDGPHVGTLWSADRGQIATATFQNESAMGWQEVVFSTPVQVTANTTYVASYHTTKGWYSSTANGLASAVDNPPLHALANTGTAGNGIYKYGPRGFPDQSWGATNYWVDVVFTLPPDVMPPSVVGVGPSDDATSVPVDTTVTATFNEAVQPGSAVVTVKNGTTAIAGTASLDASRRVLRFTPSGPLPAATKLTVRVSGAKDNAGNTMATTTTTSFTTAGACPCTLWPSDATPTNPTNTDTASVELGVKFTADTAGWVTGVRFYKGAGNTGGHTGSLWRASDQTRLATGTFTNESASGWQTLKFSAPVQLTAGTQYVASYHAPNGRYAADGNYFNGALDNAPLHAPAKSVTGGNGVYRYGSATVYPNQTYNGANYWVDPVFTTADPGDDTPPVVDDAAPEQGTTSVPRAAKPKVVFNEAVQAGTIDFTLTGPGGVTVPGTVSYDAATRTATFDPSGALDWNTPYTAKVQGVKDTAGNTLANPYTWSFATAAQIPAGTSTIWSNEAVPATPNASDAAAIEVGTKFRADSDGKITGVRFYKGSQNTGTHVGKLYDADGNLLAQVAFGGESAAGWQQATFSTPVDVTAGLTYTVAYTAPNGHYSATTGGFGSAGADNPPLHALKSGVDGPNGVYRYGAGGFPSTGGTTNYWVDVMFTTP
ncbi:DUF4082 domain-containing protein [Actinomadura macrotermitis]|uniref:DUF4082 domain-containing protein n=1 Tax=Actinomadura macrotermitis TaxID=2585200 RepID=A0A7K0BQK8_9ACTN|nr:DUF4082 domain-containing protein [Actinomadura macrotermitis]MQY03478.1 hypothetical protein [Actinomadura macrotermitis]